MEDKKWCVYKHTCLLNNKSYIGITCQNPNNRWKNGLGYKESTKFYKAIVKYGWENFSHEILEFNLAQTEAHLKEQKYIKEYDSILNGYNITQGGEGSSGRVCSKETRLKIGKANSGANNWLYGKECPDYLKNKISEANKGKIFSEEHKNKLSEAHKGKHLLGNNIKAKPVYIDNIIFSCAKECAQILDISDTVLRGWLNKSRKPPYFLNKYKIGYIGENPISAFSTQKPRKDIADKESYILNTIERLRKEVEDGAKEIA